YLAPDPVAEGDKLKVPRSGDFVRQSPGVQGAAATGCPLRAPSASGFIWHCT
ncbi:DNA helicase, partial [Shigella dysenteriae]